MTRTWNVAANELNRYVAMAKNQSQACLHFQWLKGSHLGLRKRSNIRLTKIGVVYGLFGKLRNGALYFVVPKPKTWRVLMIEMTAVFPHCVHTVTLQFEFRIVDAVRSHKIFIPVSSPRAEALETNFHTLSSGRGKLVRLRRSAPHDDRGEQGSLQ